MRRAQIAAALTRQIGVGAALTGVLWVAASLSAAAAARASLSWLAPRSSPAFMACCWAAQGVALWRAAGRLGDPAAWAITRVLLGAIMAGALVRAVWCAQSGRWPWWELVAIALELGTPALVMALRVEATPPNDLHFKDR